MRTQSRGAYDFENHLIGQGGATMVYDGDGNRVKKTVAGVTTTYLIADQNPTGYAQVVSETIAGQGTNRDQRTYVCGLERISQTRNFFNAQNFTQTSLYVYDGHGSVRALKRKAANVPKFLSHQGVRLKNLGTCLGTKPIQTP